MTQKVLVKLCKKEDKKDDCKSEEYYEIVDDVMSKKSPPIEIHLHFPPWWLWSWPFTMPQVRPYATY